MIIPPRRQVVDKMTFFPSANSGSLPGSIPTLIKTSSLLSWWATKTTNKSWYFYHSCVLHHIINISLIWYLCSSFFQIFIHTYIHTYIPVYNWLASEKNLKCQFDLKTSIICQKTFCKTLLDGLPTSTKSWSLVFRSFLRQTPSLSTFQSTWIWFVGEKEVIEMREHSNISLQLSTFSWIQFTFLKVVCRLS